MNMCLSADAIIHLQKCEQITADYADSIDAARDLRIHDDHLDGTLLIGRQLVPVALKCRVADTFQGLRNH